MKLETVLAAAVAGETLDDGTLAFLLGLETPAELEALYRAAYAVKLRYVGNQVHLRGLVEISNICRKNCFYCGIRSGNAKVARFAMSREEILEDYEMTPYTERTITDKDALREELERIRQRGYSLDDEEMFLNVRCIAVPIFDYHGSVRYSIGISGPLGIMSGENLELYKKQLVQAAKKIGAKLK